MRHWNNGTDHRHSKSCCDKSSPARRTMNPPIPTEAETNGSHFANDIFECIFLNENVWIPIKISLKFVPKVPINNIPALVQMLAWRRSGSKPLYEPMRTSLLTYICVTRPQRVNDITAAQQNTTKLYAYYVIYRCTVQWLTPLSHHELAFCVERTNCTKESLLSN